MHSLTLQSAESAQTPHRLVSVRLGPVHERFLSPAFSNRGNEPPTYVASVKVGLSNRDVFSTKARMVHWYAEQTVTATSDNVLEISFSDVQGPIWQEQDGVVIVLIERCSSSFHQLTTDRLRK